MKRRWASLVAIAVACGGLALRLAAEYLVAPPPEPPVVFPPAEGGRFEVTIKGVRLAWQPKPKPASTLPEQPPPPVLEQERVRAAAVAVAAVAIFLAVAG